MDRHSEYYEAILQLRPSNDSLLDFAINLIESKKGVNISKIKELKSGYDIYISDQKFARGTLITQLKKKFKDSEIIVSKSLYGRHRLTSKLLYRATILFRLNRLSRNPKFFI